MSIEYKKSELFALDSLEQTLIPCPRGPAGPPGPPGLRGFTGSLENAAINFAYNQLANIIEQLIKFYPDKELNVFLTGFTPGNIAGKPYKLYTSPESTFGGVFTVDTSGVYQSVPLNAISALQIVDEKTVYNPAITYLAKPYFPPGYDTNIITAIHDYIATLTGNIQFYMGSKVYASGPIYKNPYGLIVMAESTGNNPVFIPVLQITTLYPLETAKSDRATPLITLKS